MEKYFNRNPVLLYFGKRLVEDVLDKTNIQFMTTISKLDEKNNIVKKKFDSFSDIQRNAVKELIPWITMVTVSNMLQLFEENEDIQLVIDYNNKKVNLLDVSDGLEGDFLGRDGWLDRYGHFLDFVTEDSRKG